MNRGPTSQANKSILDKERFVALRSSFIKGIKVSECVLLLFIFNSFMQLLSSEIEAEAILLEVEILNIFILFKLLDRIYKFFPISFKI